MFTGYSLKKYCGQPGEICLNLPRDGRHPGSIRNVFLKNTGGDPSHPRHQDHTFVVMKYYLSTTLRNIQKIKPLIQEKAPIQKGKAKISQREVHLQSQDNTLTKSKRGKTVPTLLQILSIGSKTLTNHVKQTSHQKFVNTYHLLCQTSEVVPQM